MSQHSFGDYLSVHVHFVWNNELWVRHEVKFIILINPGCKNLREITLFPDK